ncbi:hypothetical protein BJ170DRAFT_593732 [Xylariales sp. AK1849]|nr:hypothetical protein BJ170DRAFT_593732 [Xylariales sp. AK1849]
MEIAEPLMDCNFPELLAGDLWRLDGSSFSKKPAAGAPVLSLVDDRRERRISLQDTSPGYLSSNSRDVLSQMKSLQPVHQRYSQVMAQKNGASRNSSDTTSTSSSGGMEPPSIATLGMSVTTAATSVVSGRYTPSDCSPPSVSRLSHYSWMDFDVEGNNPSPDSTNSMGQFSSPPRLLPRTGDAKDLTITSIGSDVAQSQFPDPFTAFSSPTKTLTATMEAPRQHICETQLLQPAHFPPRRSSFSSSRNQHTRPQHSISPRFPPSPSHIILQSIPSVTPTRPPPLSTRHTRRRQEVEERSTLSLNTDVSYDADLSDITILDTTGFTPREKYVSPSTDSPLTEVEQWLNSSNDIGFSHLPQPEAENPILRIPVPPEVLDTLRISVACFPETILLCSCLSIETIRSHSRKVRYRTPSLNTHSQISLTLADGSPKPSKWKWLTTKRPLDSSPNKLQARRRGYLEPPTPTPGSRKGSSDWSHIKNIFPNGTDYLCDALYAHLLAYNYITSICPRSAIVSPDPRPCSRASGAPPAPISRLNVSDSSKIPRKAASLLGLQNDPSTTTAPSPPRPTSTRTVRSKATTIIGKGSENGRAFSAATTKFSDSYDRSLKDLRLGLAKCIARLVATLRLTSTEALARSTMKPVDLKDVDPLFIRALCEIVRCCETRT